MYQTEALNHAIQRTHTHAWPLLHIQGGRRETYSHNDKPWETAIYKETLEGPVYFDQYGIIGDEHTGTPDLDRAVCVHPAAHYDFWRVYFQRDIPIGFFGENMTVGGVRDEDICVGDIIRCGTALLQVTQPRTPCYKPARKLGVPTYLKLILQTGKLGFLLRVLETGATQAGDSFTLVERAHPEANLVFVNRALYEVDNLDAASKLAALEPLAHDWRAKFAARVK